MLWSLFKFLMVGVLNSAVGLAVIFIAKSAGSMGDVPSNVLGYAVGLVVSFVLNRGWTFRHTGDALPAALRFATVILVAYGLNLATVLWAIHVLQMDTYVSQALGIVPYTLFTFVGLRYYAFREGSASPKQTSEREAMLR
ncbi:MAG: GtrA family protein [Rhodospirillaceae bacterium]